MTVLHPTELDYNWEWGWKIHAAFELFIKAHFRSSGMIVPSPNAVFSQFRYNKMGLLSAHVQEGTDCWAGTESYSLMLARLVRISAAASCVRVGSRFQKDTEAAVRDVQVPEVDPQVIGRHVGLVVGVDGDGVDVVGVGVGEHSPRTHLHHQVHGL